MNQKKDDLLPGEEVAEKRQTSGPGTETAEETTSVEETTVEAGGDDDDDEDTD